MVNLHTAKLHLLLLRINLVQEIWHFPSLCSYFCLVMYICVMFVQSMNITSILKEFLSDSFNRKSCFILVADDIITKQPAK